MSTELAEQKNDDDTYEAPEKVEEKPKLEKFHKIFTIQNISADTPKVTQIDVINAWKELISDQAKVFPGLLHIENFYENITADAKALKFNTFNEKYNLLDQFIILLKRQKYFSEIINNCSENQNQKILIKIINFDQKFEKFLNFLKKSINHDGGIFNKSQLKLIYNASNSELDLQIFEKLSQNFGEFNIFTEPIFGNFKEGLSLQERFEYFVKYFKKDGLYRTCFEDTSRQSGNCYDSKFILQGLFYYLNNNFINVNTITGKLLGYNNGGIVMVIISLLSNNNANIRHISLQLLAKIYNEGILSESNKFPDKSLIRYIFKSILLPVSVKTLKENPDSPVPVCLTLYLVTLLYSITTLQTGSSSSSVDSVTSTTKQNYQEMSNFILSRPNLQEENFPNFLSCWFSRDNNFKNKRKFILNFISNCIYKIENGHHFKNLAKLGCFNILLSDFSSLLLDEQEKGMILDIVVKCCRIEYCRNRLIKDYDLEGWLDVVDYDDERREKVEIIRELIK